MKKLTLVSIYWKGYYTSVFVNLPYIKEKAILNKKTFDLICIKSFGRLIPNNSTYTIGS